MQDLIAALGVALVLEGAVYALFAAPMKRTIARFLEAPDEALRLMGLLTALFGIFIVWLVRG